MLLFHYESLRANYLNPLLQPLLHRDLPKCPLLFPPSGWIMFFEVEPRYGFAEVYGFRQGRSTKLDPHAIFATRALGYDNIRRNVLVGVLSPSAIAAPPQCVALRQRHPRAYGMMVLSGVCRDPAETPATTLPFCRYLQRKFPREDAFAVVEAEYPDLIHAPEIIRRRLAYRCP